ncbi:MAG: hypothetical protein ACU0FH_02020 [Heliomarina sp.]|uniref:hypothetical protein n=1 Tax=Heliomarina sp. TaxID=2917556 RepID=UPI0040589C58
MEHTSGKSLVAGICQALGRRNIGEGVGVGKTAVGNAVSEGIFPASWYRVVKSLCDETGIECPLEAFNFKSISNEDAA